MVLSKPGLQIGKPIKQHVQAWPAHDLFKKQKALTLWAFCRAGLGTLGGGPTTALLPTILAYMHL